MSRLHVAVIGGGVAGMSAAMHAAGLGADVTVLEREHPASGSSSLSFGVFNRQTPALEELELRVYSVALLERLERTCALPLQRTGYLRLARRPDDLDRFAAALDAQRRLGYAGGRLLSPADVRALVPFMRCDDVAGALYGSDDGHFDGHLVCAAYQDRAEAAGARVRVRTVVLGADRRPDAIVLHTNQGDVRCDRVINATGAWAPAVAALFDVSCPIFVQRHAVCQGKLTRPLAETLPTVNEYVPGSGDYALIVRQESAERLLVMLHSHEPLDSDAPVDPDGYSRAVGFDYVERVAERLADRFPGLADDLSLEGGWAGLYPISPDGRFQVGPYRAEPRLIAATGLGGVGITVSGAVGRLAAEWAVTGEGSAFAFADHLLPDRPSLAYAAHRLGVEPVEGGRPPASATPAPR